MDRAGRRLRVLAAQLPQAASPAPAPADAALPALARSYTAAAAGSVWSQVPQAPPDAILGISDAFKKDNDSRKLNLGVGAYRTEVRSACFLLAAVLERPELPSSQIRMGRPLSVKRRGRLQEGKPLVLEVVKRAEHAVINDPNGNKVSTT